MIAKEVPKRKGKSSYTRLVTYLTDPKGNPNRVLHVRATNLLNADVSDDLGLGCALTEVAEMQARNTRATEKTLHLMLSFHEHLDLQTLSEIEQRVVDGIGYGEHQRISVVHGDTDHPHLHIAINKVYQEVDPETGTVRYLSRHLEFGKRKLAALAQELERDYGLVPDNHGAQVWESARHEDLRSTLQQGWVHAARQAGTWDQVKAACAAHGIELRATGKTGLRLVASDGRTLAASKLGKEFSRSALEKRLGPLQGDLGAQPAAPAKLSADLNGLPLAQRIKKTAGRALREASTWQERHAVAAAHGLRMLERGGGLVFEDMASGQTTTASSVSNQLSLGRSQKRIGPYVPAPDLGPAVTLREAVVNQASAQAVRDHQRRRAAVLALPLTPGGRKVWLDASQRTTEADRRLIEGLHAFGRELEQAPSHHWPRLRDSTPARIAIIRAYALRLRASIPGLAPEVHRHFSQHLYQELQRANTFSAPPPRRRHFVRGEEARSDRLRHVSRRGLVHAAQQRPLLLPSHAHRDVQQQQSRGADHDVRRADRQLDRPDLERGLGE